MRSSLRRRTSGKFRVSRLSRIPAFDPTPRAPRVASERPGTLDDSAIESFLAPIAHFLDSVPSDYFPPGLSCEASNQALQLGVAFRSLHSKYHFRERIGE